MEPWLRRSGGRVSCSFQRASRIRSSAVAHHEDAAPVKQRHQHAAQHRRADRRQPVHQHQQREKARQLMAAVHIARHRARQYRAARARQAFEQARQQKLVDILRQRAADRGDEQQRQRKR